ncbi:RDD family protein [Actinoplanes sp. TBRC 11911]|uniref:RDD family protein n=1 Tax=Actinoplanes sp. TBRC 11911 TaxID=2729386 RepID=UPI00145C4C08|nr:RDD family protein [Actinoplanes sp. TBRC 11911]NMO52798.1 RDD family protein [Actinoplanes sp. TBRC 11911]
MSQPQEPLRDLTYASLMTPQPAPGPASAAGMRLVSPAGRLGAFLLEILLAVVTLGIGYVIWSLIVWSDGQTPGKQLLGLVVADAQTGAPVDFGRMLMREFVLYGLLFGLLSAVTFGVFFAVDALLVFGTDRRTLHDKLAGTVVRYA